MATIDRFPSIIDAVTELGLDPSIYSSVINDPVLAKIKNTIDQLYNRVLVDISRFGEPHDENYEYYRDAFAGAPAPLKNHEAVALIAQHWIDEAKDKLTKVGAFGKPASTTTPVPTPTP